MMSMVHHPCTWLPFSYVENLFIIVLLLLNLYHIVVQVIVVFVFVPLMLFLKLVDLVECLFGVFVLIIQNGLWLILNFLSSFRISPWLCLTLPSIFLWLQKLIQQQSKIIYRTKFFKASQFFLLKLFNLHWTLHYSIPHDAVGIKEIQVRLITLQLELIMFFKTIFKVCKIV